VERRPTTTEARRLSGLPSPDLLSDPVRVERVRGLAERAGGSRILKGLVQVATAVRCAEAAYSEQVSDLADSLCTVTVLSGDVLVAADARSHPWLHDLPPVTSGAVGCYLGVPLLLADGTAVGALCVYGPEAREWNERHVGLTCEVADIVAEELDRLSGLGSVSP